MRVFHDHRVCRISPSFTHCNCGAAEVEARLEQLESERQAIERLIEGAEEFHLGESPSRTPYVDKMVRASDLADVLAGRMR